MSQQRRAESTQIPLFDVGFLPPKFNALEDAVQVPLLECEPTQLSFSFKFPIDPEKLVFASGRAMAHVHMDNWERAQLLRRAASYMPQRSVQQVLDFCAQEAPGDSRPVVIEFVARKIIAKGERAITKCRPRPVRISEEEGLCRWAGGLKGNSSYLPNT